MAKKGQELELALRQIFRQSVEPVPILPSQSLTDEEVIEQYPHLASVVPNARQLVSDLWQQNYGGNIFWRVPAGFTAKQHAPVLGPCWKDFQYLQDWAFEDPPTQDTLTFWPPRLVPKSTSKTVDQQRGLLAELRQKYELPEHWFTGFGDIGLLANLILSHYKESAERVPLNSYWARTEARLPIRRRLGLGDFDEDGLDCDGWGWGGDRSSRLGCFALGVEALGN